MRGTDGSGISSDLLTEIGELALVPATGGVFEIRIGVNSDGERPHRNEVFALASRKVVGIRIVLRRRPRPLLSSERFGDSRVFTYTGESPTSLCNRSSSPFNFRITGAYFGS
jgi:hypothetical protein